MDEIKQRVMEMLFDYLKESEDSTMVSVFADRAMMAFREYKNYPDTWDDDSIIADMTKHISCITDLALYECIQQGAEFQSMHIESGLYRMWNNKGNIYTNHGIVPFATL